MLYLLFPPLVVLALLPLRHPTSEARASAFRREGLGWTLLFALLAGLFIAGETFGDPGGGEAALLVISWVIPLAGLSLLAWSRPRVAAPVLVAVVLVGLAFSAWDGLGNHDHHGGFLSNGPIATIALFAAAVAVGVLGWHRPALAAALLLAIAVLPTVFLTIGTDVPLRGRMGGSTAAGTMPFGVSGALYLLAAWFGRTGADRTITLTRPPLPDRELSGH
jgi:hypothetical protein